MACERHLNISIHALRGEGDGDTVDKIIAAHLISIHALRGEGDEQGEEGSTPPMISIHALRGEGDHFYAKLTNADKVFQSTPSVGRATKSPMSCQTLENISIHALRGEGDMQTKRQQEQESDFNPRPPWGGRLSRIFLSTPSYCYFNPRPPWGGRLKASAKPLQ